MDLDGERSGFVACYSQEPISVGSIDAAKLFRSRTSAFVSGKDTDLDAMHCLVTVHHAGYDRHIAAIGVGDRGEDRFAVRPLRC